MEDRDDAVDPPNIQSLSCGPGDDRSPLKTQNMIATAIKHSCLGEIHLPHQDLKTYI